MDGRERTPGAQRRHLGGTGGWVGRVSVRAVLANQDAAIGKTRAGGQRTAPPCLGDAGAVAPDFTACHESPHEVEFVGGDWRKQCQGFYRQRLLRSLLLKTSQSRLARMEARDTSVSLDLLARGLFALGAPAQLTWPDLHISLGP